MITDASTPRSPLEHAALLYRDIEQLRQTVGEFVADATAAGEPILALLPGHDLELLQDVLGADTRREDMAIAGANPSRIIPQLLDFTEAHPQGAWIISESLWPGRGSAEGAECLRHEALLNHALAQSSARVLCPFDAEHLDGEWIAGAALTHPQLIDAAGVRRSDDYGEPLDIARGEHWPQGDPPVTVADLGFDGDLWALRRRLADDARLRTLAPGRREDLVFAVNEAASNAVRHGDGTCRARLWHDGDRVVIEVVTPSQIGDPLAGRRRPDPSATGGRGLWLINQVCDLVELRNGPDGASLRMHMVDA